MFLTLDKENQLIQYAYNISDSNILIRDNLAKNNLCYIYCSSNAIYVKDDVESFEENILENNKFEFTSCSAKVTPKREIFLRDIWLSWYVLGINFKENTIDRLISKLKKLTLNYQIITVGCSSGGYLASILAIKLNAYMCFNFNGQFSLKNHFDHVHTNPFLNNYYAITGGGVS